MPGLFWTLAIVSRYWYAGTRSRAIDGSMTAIVRCSYWRPWREDSANCIGLRSVAYYSAVAGSRWSRILAGWDSSYRRELATSL